jgi:hypothetical protein
LLRKPLFFQVGLSVGCAIIGSVMRGKMIGWLFCVLTAFIAAESLSAQGTAFTYQGQLADGGDPANGSYDLTFALYNSTSLASPVTYGPVTNSAVLVTNGLFTTTLDFGTGVFIGVNYWLQIGVRVNGDTNAFTNLSPRQPLLPVPYAIFAGAASNLLGSLATTQLNGTLPSAQINGTYSSAVSFSNSANHFAGTFGGDGSSLSNLNASRLTSGTVADARLSANVALLNTNQTFTGSNIFTGFNFFNGTNNFTGVNTFTNFGNSFRGSFFGNGLVGWIPTNGTAVQAVIDTGYVLTNLQLVTVTLPATPNVGDIVRISGAGTGGWKIAQNTGQSVIGNFLSYSNSYWTLAKSADNWESIACSADGSKLVAVNDANGAYVSANSGATWSLPNAPPSSGHGTASVADGTRLFAVVNGGGIFSSINYGASWQSIGPGNTTWYAMASSADGTKLVAAVNGGGIYNSANAGGTWPLMFGPANWVSVASSADGTKLLAAISGGVLYISVNSGTTWQPTGPGSASWTAVASSADGTKLAAAYNGGIYTSLDSGAHWSASTAQALNWSCIASSADGFKLAAAVNGGGIYTSANAGATWTKQFGAANLNWISITSSADGTRLAAVTHSLSGSGGGIYLSQAAWQKTTLMGTNGSITGGQGTAVELQYIGNGQFMPVSSAGTIWAN